MLNSIVRLSSKLFPPKDPDSLWNNRIVRVTECVTETYIKQDSLYRVEPLWMENEEDFLHVHQYEMEMVYSTDVTEEDTHENAYS